MAESHRIREIIILSPTTLAGAITNPAILKSEEQMQLLRCLPNIFVTSEKFNCGAEKYLRQGDRVGWRGSTRTYRVYT